MIDTYSQGWIDALRWAEQVCRKNTASNHGSEGQRRSNILAHIFFGEAETVARTGKTPAKGDKVAG